MSPKPSEKLALPKLEKWFDLDVDSGRAGVGLPASIQHTYGSDFILPPTNHEHAVASVNFVGLWDGIVNIPEAAGGAAINGGNVEDRAVMAILRATHDAVLVGSETLVSEPEHLWTVDYIFPEWKEVLGDWRESRGKSRHPMNVIVSRSGMVRDKATGELVPLRHDFPVFTTPGVRALVLTTNEGANVLLSNGWKGKSERYLQLVNPKDFEATSLSILKYAYGIGHVLIEGGPMVNGAYHAQGLISDDFHTLAPGMAGRTKDSKRASLMMGYEFPPDGIPRPKLISVRMSGDYLMLRARYKQR